MFQKWHEQLKEHRGLAGAFLILVPYLVYSGSLANWFAYDDEAQILRNPYILNSHLWPRIFTGSVWSFLGVAFRTTFYRPLQFFSYWLIYRLSGPNPAGFHLVNVLLYAASVCLVCQLGRKLFQNELAAFAGALLWALHPLHVEPVVWVSALADVGFGFFYLLAFLLFLNAERAANGRAQRHVLAALAYFPALFFKEMALSFPLMLLAYWLFLGERESWLKRAPRCLPYLAAIICYSIIRVSALGTLASSPHPWKVAPIVALSAASLLGEHTRLYLWPTHLNVFRTFEPSLRSPWLWGTLLLLLAIFRVRKREPVLSFLVFWWPVGLVPALDIRQLSFPLLAERFSYVPSIGLSLAIAHAAISRLPQWVPCPKVPRLVPPSLAMVMVLWAVQTVRAIPNWHDNEVLAQYSIKQSPDAAMLHIFQGETLQYRRGDLDGAAREFQTALRLNQVSLQPPVTIFYDCYLSLGQIAYQRGEIEEAVAYFEKAARILPGYSTAYDSLGSVYFPRGDYLKAAEYFLQATRVGAQDLGARFYLGTCWMKLGKYREAAEQFHAAREVDPTYWQAFEAEARALEAAGDFAAAAQVRILTPKRQ